MIQLFPEWLSYFSISTEMNPSFPLTLSWPSKWHASSSVIVAYNSDHSARSTHKTMIHGYSEPEGCNLFYTKLAIFVDNLKSLMEIS